MAKAIEHVKAEFGAVRTGRATPALVESLMVDYYGTADPAQAAGQLHRARRQDARRLALRQELPWLPSRRPSALGPGHHADQRRHRSSASASHR